jgi:hypothetical protein
MVFMLSKDFQFGVSATLEVNKFILPTNIIVTTHFPNLKPALYQGAVMP